MSAKPTDGYKGHITGSRKGEVHRLFDMKGAETAEKWGLTQGLQKGTLKSWFGFWRRADKPAAKPVEKKAAAKKADKPAAKKTGKPKGDATVKKVTKDNRQTVTKRDASMGTTPTT